MISLLAKNTHEHKLICAALTPLCHTNDTRFSVGNFVLHGLSSFYKYLEVDEQLFPPSSTKSPVFINLFFLISTARLCTCHGPVLLSASAGPAMTLVNPKMIWSHRMSFDPPVCGIDRHPKSWRGPYSVKSSSSFRQVNVNYPKYLTVSFPIKQVD